MVLEFAEMTHLVRALQGCTKEPCLLQMAARSVVPRHFQPCCEHALVARRYDTPFRIIARRNQRTPNATYDYKIGDAGFVEPMAQTLTSVTVVSGPPFGDSASVGGGQTPGSYDEWNRLLKKSANDLLVEMI